MRAPLPFVSDHAVLRYLERAHDVPVESIRMLLAIAASGQTSGAVPIGKRVKIVLDNGIVVTCLKRHWTLREDMIRERRS